MNENHQALFVWRGTETFENYLPQYYGPLSECPFCASMFQRTASGEKGFWDDDDEIILACGQCGFQVRRFEDILNLGAGAIGFGDAYPATLWRVAQLRTLDINSSELGLGELGSYLRRNVSDIYALAPRRFELLVADIFRNLGYHAQLTQETRDGGYDILLSDTEGNQILVECKRYAQHRRVCVSTVRELLGVQLCKGVRFGKLVTTTVFTEPARTAALEVNRGETGFHLDLVDLEELTKHLSVYNVALPPQELMRRFGG